MKLQINMVVADARESADYYRDLFGAEIISMTDLETSLNETNMMIGGTEMKVLSENRDYGLIAPAEGVPSSMWINLYVEDIRRQFEKSEEYGCAVISPVTEFNGGRAVNAVIRDRYGHFWVLNQIVE